MTDPNGLDARRASDSDIGRRNDSWLFSPLIKNCTVIVGLMAGCLTIYAFVGKHHAEISSYFAEAGWLLGSVTIASVLMAVFAFCLLFVIRTLHKRLQSEKATHSEMRAFTKHLLASLPLLFQKTTHLKQALSRTKLESLRNSLRNYDDGDEDQFDPTALASPTLVFIGESARRLLTDLREAIQKVTGSDTNGTVVWR